MISMALVQDVLEVKGQPISMMSTNHTMQTVSTLSTSILLHSVLACFDVAVSVY